MGAEYFEKLCCKILEKNWISKLKQKGVNSKTTDTLYMIGKIKRWLRLLNELHLLRLLLILLLILIR